MVHSKTIKNFADLRPRIKLEVERLIVDKSKEMDKVALHFESTPPLSLLCTDQWLRKKFH